MNTRTIEQSIKEQYESELLRPFPLKDLIRLKSIDPDKWGVLHGELDLYFAYIGGYASSADRLQRRPKAELIEARRYLSESFFEKYQSLAVYRDVITEEFTPNLFRELAAADKLRKELLVVMDQILSGRVADRQQVD